jgi:hypothetical protein
LTSTSLVNCVRPVASITPGRVRALAAIDNICSASMARSSRIVADAGSVPMYARPVSLLITAQPLGVVRASDFIGAVALGRAPRLS